MTIAERLALTGRIAVCVTAGSVAGFLAWAIGALGIGSLAWAAPPLLIAALFFGLPAIGLVLAAGLIFARSIHRHETGWCLGLPIAVIFAWRIYRPAPAFPPHGTILIASCAAASSALFFLWSRYRAPRPPAAA